MPQVAVMEFDKEKRKFNLLDKVDLASIPTAGDKIVLAVENTSFIFKVYDVHYCNGSGVKVNVIRISTIEEYNASGFRDIIYFA